MNHFLLHLFARTAGPSLRGKKIGAVRYLAPVLSIEMTGGKTPGYLAVILASPGPYIYLSENDPLTGVGCEVFRRIKGLPVKACEQVGDDRMIRLELGSGRERAELVLRLFGSSGRARILGPDSIIESLDSRETGRPRPTPTKPRNPSFAVVDSATLNAALAAVHGEPPAGPNGKAPAREHKHLPAGARGSGSGTGSGQPIDRAVPGLTRGLLECFPADTNGESPADVAAMLAWRDEMLEGSCRFHVGTRGGRFGAVGPIPDPAPKGLSQRFGPFNRVDIACKRVGESIVDAIRDDMIALQAAPLTKHLDGRTRLAQELENDLDTAGSFENWRKEAVVLAAFQSTIPPGSSGVALPDPYGSGEELTIKLDPALSISDQIEKRFKRAAKLERSRQAILTRIETVRADIESLENELAAVAKQTTLGDAIRRIEAAVDRFELAPKQHKPSRESRAAKTYRRYELDSMWFVLVGRNNKENDEITFRVAAPDDIWMHAHQVPGSHVILKSHGAPGNPPAAILEAAAGLAAHFSKARHASLVPVIYTRRKYVRKFKGARPGQVTCEREKTIMAEPTLPDSPQREPGPR